MPKNVVGFDFRDAEKLTQILRQSPPTSTDTPKTNRVYLRECDDGIVSTAFTARSGVTLGTGKVTSLTRTNDDGTDYEYSEVQNIYSQTVAKDTYCHIQRNRTGAWTLVSADCQ